jgi:membrane associated rhomboid family serine protease
VHRYTGGVTELAPPADAAAPPPGPAPVALAIAFDLVTRYRLRLADVRDSRLAALGAPYELAAALWNGPRAALVAFYEPPEDPAAAGRDLAARCEAARRWGHERLQIQQASACDILLIALRPVGGAISAATSPSDPVRIGAAWVDARGGSADQLLPIPAGLPSVGELRGRARAVRGGAPTPTLAAVDLAERQTVAGGYTAPVRRQMITQPYVTYGLIAAFALIYIFEKVLIPSSPGATGPDLYDFGALASPQYFGTQSWWRYISSAFLHDPGSIYHVFFNGIAMLFIGRLVEQFYGRLVLLGTFLATAVGGGLLWQAALAVGWDHASATLGASGGISGLVGLLLMLGRVQGRKVPVGIAHGIRNYAITVIALNIFLGFSGLFGFSFVSGVNNFAHVGGLLSGAILGLLLPPLAGIGGRDLKTAEKVVLGVVIAAGAVALVIAMVHVVGAYTSPSTPS